MERRSQMFDVDSYQEAADEFRLPTMDEQERVGLQRVRDGEGGEPPETEVLRRERASLRRLEGRLRAREARLKLVKESKARVDAKKLQASEQTMRRTMFAGTPRNPFTADTELERLNAEAEAKSA